MTLSSNKTLLNDLLHDIKRVETSLDFVMKTVETIFKKHPNANSSKDAKLADYIEQEKLQTQKWAKAFRRILNYQPRNFEELKHKTLIMLEYSQAGHDNPKILKTIKNDMQAFSFEQREGQSQHRSLQRLNA